MKAIILERRGDWAAALREDGTVVKTRTDAQVGETIELSATILNLPDFNSKWVRTAAAAVLVLALAGGSFNYYNTAVAASYVSVDVGESSVELSVNRLGRVIGVTALNDESQELAEALRVEIHQKKVDDAVDRTMAKLQESGELTGKEDVIVGVTGESGGQSTRLAEAVERGMEKARESHDDMNIYTLKGDRNQRNEAQKQGMSPGRFFAMNDAGGNGPEGHGPKPSRFPVESQTTESAEPRETQAAAMQTPPPLPGDSQLPAPPTDGPTEPPTPPSGGPAEPPAESGVPAVGPGPKPSQAATPAPTVRPTQAPKPTARPAQTQKPVQTQRPVQTPTPAPTQTVAPVQTPPPPPVQSEVPVETPTPPVPTPAPVETLAPPAPSQAQPEPTQVPPEPTQAPPAPTQEQPPQPGPFDGPPGKLLG